MYMERAKQFDALGKNVEFEEIIIINKIITVCN